MIARAVAAVVLAAACVTADDEPLRLGSTAWRHAGPVTGVAFVDGGEQVITSSLDGTWVWRDPDSGAATARVGDASRPVLGLSAGDDGAWLAVTIREGVDEAGDPRISTIVYDERRHVEIFVEPLHVDGTAVLSRDGKRLASRTAGERTVTVHDVESRDEVATLEVGLDGDEAPWWAALSDDGAWLLAGGRRATSRRDMSAWVELHPVDGGEPIRHVVDGAPLAFASSADGRRAGVVADGTLHVVAPDAEVSVHDLGDRTVTALAFVDDARVVTRGADGIALRALGESGSSAVLWSAPSAMPVLDFAVDVPGGRLAPIGRSSDVTLLALSDGRRLDAPARHPGRITAVGIAPGGDVVVTGGWTGEVMAWDAASGERVAATDTAAGVISGVGFVGDDGRFVVVAGREGRIVVLDRERGLETVADVSLGEPILALDVAPDGSRVATGHRAGVVRVWTPADDGALVEDTAVSVGRRHVTALAWSPDDARLAVVATSLVHVVDVAARDVVGTYEPRCPVADVDWAAGRLAVALATRTARVLDAATLDEVFTTPRFTARVATVALSADGARLAAAAVGRPTARVFDVDGDDAPRELDAGAEDVSCLAWRGALLVAGSGDGTALVRRP